MPFKSKAQVRFAFATKKPWAQQWADETASIKALPEKAKRRKVPVPGKRRKKSGRKS